MRLRPHLLRLLIAAVLWLGVGNGLRGQSLGTGGGATPTLGQLALPSGNLMGAGSAPKAPQPLISITDSYVSILDGALPRSMFMLRVDAGYHNREPSRAEYFLAKGGLPNSTGFPRIETKVDYQEMTSYAEYAMSPWFSVFLEAPYRWINPDVNANESGAGDMRYGLKLCTWSSNSVIATVLLRLYQPTARHSTLGTNHWSVEPGFLGACRLTDNVLLEGEFRYWIPLNGSDFAGDIFRYGAGVSYGRRNPFGPWYMPVAEVVGWTVMGGKSIEASSPDHFTIQDARGQTTLNGYLGLRFGYGHRVDTYLGYGRSFTEHAWQQDFVRFEVRFLY